MMAEPTNPHIGRGGPLPINRVVDLSRAVVNPKVVPARHQDAAVLKQSRGVSIRFDGLLAWTRGQKAKQSQPAPKKSA